MSGREAAEMLHEHLLRAIGEVPERERPFRFEGQLFALIKTGLGVYFGSILYDEGGSRTESAIPAGSIRALFDPAFIRKARPFFYAVLRSPLPIGIRYAYVLADGEQRVFEVVDEASRDEMLEFEWGELRVFAQVWRSATRGIE